MVKKRTTTADSKLNRERKLTIFDPLGSNEDVQAELNDLAMTADCLVKLDDDRDEGVDDVEVEVSAGYHSHKYDESMVLGLMGMFGMTLPDEIEELLSARKRKRRTKNNKNEKSGARAALCTLLQLSKS
jgi:hypothetical protein